MAHLETVYFDKGFLNDLVPFYLLNYLNRMNNSDYPKILHVGIGKNYLNISFAEQDITEQHKEKIKKYIYAISL